MAGVYLKRIDDTLGRKDYRGAAAKLTWFGFDSGLVSMPRTLTVEALEWLGLGKAIADLADVADDRV